jgi:hypothetical protein
LERLRCQKARASNVRWQFVVTSAMAGIYGGASMTTASGFFGDAVSVIASIKSGGA